MNAFLAAITLDYILVCLSSFLLVIYVIHRVITSNPPNGDFRRDNFNDDDGGGPLPPQLPVDIPPSHGKKIKLEEEEEMLVGLIWNPGI